MVAKKWKFYIDGAWEMRRDGKPSAFAARRMAKKEDSVVKAVNRESKNTWR